MQLELLGAASAQPPITVTMPVADQQTCNQCRRHDKACPWLAWGCTGQEAAAAAAEIIQLLVRGGCLGSRDISAAPSMANSTAGPSLPGSRTPHHQHPTLRGDPQAQLLCFAQPVLTPSQDSWEYQAHSPWVLCWAMWWAASCAPTHTAHRSTCSTFCQDWLPLSRNLPARCSGSASRSAASQLKLKACAGWWTGWQQLLALLQGPSTHAIEQRGW